MHFLRATTLWVVFVSIRGNYSEFGGLIERIHQEIDTATVFLIGINDAYLSEYSKGNCNNPAEIYTSFPSDFNKQTSTGRNVILVVQVVRRNDDEMIEEFILQLNVRKFVIIIAHNMELLKEYFLYFGTFKFTRIFGITDGISFAYLPYADITVQELDKVGPLPDALQNLNGFNFRTTVQADIPRAFWYQDKNNQWAIGGYVGQLFLCFLQLHNATFTEILINNSSKLFLPGVINATIYGDIDISMNTYGTTDGLQLSYPLKFLSWTIIVPFNGNVDPNQYFIQPFSTSVWVFIGFTLVYIIIMDILKDFYANMPIDVWAYASRTLLILLSSPSNSRVTYGYRFHCQVLLFAFIIGNLYIIYLTSFLTIFIKIKQYNTIQDLIENNVPLMMVDYEWNSIADPELHPAGLEKIVVLVDGTVYNRERNSMKNTSFAYAAGMDKAEFLVGLQANFAKPQFHTINDSLMDYYLGFLLVKYSPFLEILNDCIIRIMETGLMGKWFREAVVRGHDAGLVDVATPSENLLIPLTLNHLRFAWNCLIIGLTGAFLIFLGEHYVGGVKKVFKCK